MKAMQSVYKSAEKRDALIASYNRILSTWAVEHEERDLETSYGVTHCIVSGSPELPRGGGTRGATIMA